jgi:hypothetical protein
MIKYFGGDMRAGDALYFWLNGSNRGANQTARRRRFAASNAVNARKKTTQGARL